MKTFVGFGFGPIQSGLFLMEAYRSGNFSRYVVAEVDPVLVKAVRDNGGACTINIARRDRTDHVIVRGIEICNPRDEADRRRIVDAVADADEIATALPSVDFYDSDPSASVADLLAAGLSRPRRRQAVILYAAENHNQAAEILTQKISTRSKAGLPEGVQILNTVIGKMSGVIEEAEIRQRMGLVPIAPGMQRAILVEEFNRILISRIRLPGVRRGIEIFVEKEDLLPFEEAKLYGHNAVHALIGYLANLKGLVTMAEAGRDEAIMRIARAAFLDECGAALVRRHAGLGDALFTPEGCRAYAEDLLERMSRPNLNDRVARVIRDPVRKLGPDDRFFGAMRLAMEQRIEPVNLAAGAAAAVLSLVRQPALGKAALPLPARSDRFSRDSLQDLLSAIWGGRDDRALQPLIDLTWRAMREMP